MRECIHEMDCNNGTKLIKWCKILETRRYTRKVGWKGMSTVKKWIEERRYSVCFIAVVMMLLCGMLGCGDGKEKLAVDEWKKKTSVAVASQAYQDAAGNKIVYYCCKTTYYENTDVIEAWTVDRQALSAVIDLERMEEGRACMVGQWPAVLCSQEGRAYLCWTISPEYSCVIEYDAEAVAEEDIFRMAESVVQQ